MASLLCYRITLTFGILMLNCNIVIGTNKLYRTEHYSRDHQLCNHLTVFQHFMKPEGSIPRLEEPCIMKAPYVETEFVLHEEIYLLGYTSA
jgi:hypothetical protein